MTPSYCMYEDCDGYVCFELQNRLKESNDEYDELEEKYNKLKSVIFYLKLDYDAVLQENISLKDLYNNANEECDRLRDMLAELDYENRNLKNHLSEMYDECILKGADKEFGDI